MTNSQNNRIVYTSAEDARIQFAAAVEGEPNKIATLSGYAIVWNVPSSDRGGYKVRLAPGSATFTSNVHALYHHEFRDVLGDTASQTLRILPADDYGVPVEIDLPNTGLGRDLLELVRTSRVRGMSFAMTDAPTAVENVEGDQTYLDVSAFVCDEVTVTPIPAFTETTIAVKPDPQPETFAKKNPGATEERIRQMRKNEEHRLSVLKL
jgi:HK97 family phage prohead protease